ncbi:Cys-tRNA(Pro) deacylase [Alsobacter sp. R-9]
MMARTRATQALERLGIAHEVKTYAYDPSADRIGLQAAEALGEPPAVVLKTLMTEVDGKPACVVLASDAEVSMKRLAAALGAKGARMMKPEAAERITGYHVGGISPFGQKRVVPTVVDASALGHGHVYVNGGQRGVQIRLTPADLMRGLAAVVAPLAA